jgi:hypothetical protein
MASTIQLTQLSEKERKGIKDLPAVEVVETKWPRKVSSAAEGNEAFKRWEEKLPAPTITENRPIKIEAIEPTGANLSRLAAVLNSKEPHVEVLRQEFDETTLVSTVYSAFLAHRYLEAQGKTERTGKNAESQRAELTKAFQTAFEAAGHRNMTEAKLAQYAKQVAANPAILDAVTKMVNSAHSVDVLPESKVPAAGFAKFIPVTATVVNGGPIVNTIPNLCAGPLVQGTFTKHFGGSFSLTIGFQGPCIPKWWNKCWYQVTVGSVSYSLDLNIGYKVNCCGASVWGQGVAQACASALGHTACASISGNITGVAGVTKTVGSGGCNYGLGIVGSIKGTLAGYTLFSVPISVGYTIAAPCPPKGLNC